MTDGEGRACFHYAERHDGQEHEEVRLAILTAYGEEGAGHDADTVGGRHGAKQEERMGNNSSCSGEEDGGDEVEEDEGQEPELEVEAGPSLGVRIRAPIRDPDCVSEEEEQQPYPALAPVAFFCLKQTTRPRNWCLRMVCNPYPFKLLGIEPCVIRGKPKTSSVQ